MDAAIGSMKTIAKNEDEFSRLHPDIGYSCKLAAVAKDTAIAGGRRTGYVFEIAECRTRTAGPNMTYHATARPLDPNLPAYCIDESGVLRTEDDGLVANCIKNGHSP
jgi:hypothetical protein